MVVFMNRVFVRLLSLTHLGSGWKMEIIIFTRPRLFGRFEISYMQATRFHLGIMIRRVDTIKRHEQSLSLTTNWSLLRRSFCIQINLIIHAN